LKYITTQQPLAGIAQELIRAPSIAIDLETTGLDPFTSKIRLLSISTGTDIYVIDTHPGPVLDALAGYQGVIIGHNLKFDQKFALHHWGIKFGRVFDTYRASAILHNGRNLKHDLWSLYRRDLKIEPKVEDLGGSDWSGDLTPPQLAYAADDVTHLPRLRDTLKPQLTQADLNETAQLEFQAILPEASIELNGIYLCKDRWRALALRNEAEAERLRKELMMELPDPSDQVMLPGHTNSWNLASQPELLKSLRKAQVPVDATNKTALILGGWKRPLVKKILAWRKAYKAATMYGTDYLRNVHPVTGRVHTSLYPFTGAGRYSSSNPNLQQIPRTKEFRDCFRGDFSIADYSQIEIRVAAEISGDEVLRNIYLKNGDVHTHTASLLTHGAVDKEARQKAKAVNFGFLFGMQAAKFVTYAKTQYDVHMNETEAALFRFRYMNAYPGIARWHREVRRHGETRTIGGRRRFLEPTDFNEYTNSPVQGTAADIMKRALRLTYDKGIKLVLTIHDELIAEGDCLPDLVGGMEEAGAYYLKSVPVKAEGGRGESWAAK
jgi:DNA polymerase-1